MADLRRLTAAHRSAALAFELVNRAYFAGTISDRGDAFFEDFWSGHAELLAERQTGWSAYFVLVGPADPADLGGRPGSWCEREIVLPPS